MYGAYYYATQHINLSDPLVYARAHKNADWAPALDYYVGFYYYQRSEFPKAQQAFTQLLADYPTGQYAAKGLYLLGDSADNNHDWETAKATLTRYLDEYPGGAEVNVVRKRLDILKYQH